MNNVTKEYDKKCLRDAIRIVGKYDADGEIVSELYNLIDQIDNPNSMRHQYEDFINGLPRLLLHENVVIESIEYFNPIKEKPSDSPIMEYESTNECSITIRYKRQNVKNEKENPRRKA